MSKDAKDKPSAHPSIAWSQERLDVVAYQGRRTVKLVTFTSSQSLRDVSVEPVPELAGFLSVEPKVIPEVTAGQPQPLKLTFKIPHDARPGAFDGTVHVRAGNRTFPQTAKVTLAVKERPAFIDGGPLDPGLVQLVGASETRFNPLPNTIRFEVTEFSFDADPAKVRVFLENQQLPAGAILLEAEAVTVNVTLREGKNVLRLLARDDWGRAVYKRVTLWAGRRQLTVAVADEKGQPAAGARVVLRLGDDQSVAAEAQTADGGTAVFTNLPNRTVVLYANASGNRYASHTTVGGVGLARMKLITFGVPSPIDNNDFSLGTTAGWETGNAPVFIIQHQEQIATLAHAFTAAQASAESDAPRQDLEALVREREARWAEMQARSQGAEGAGDDTPGETQQPEGDGARFATLSGEGSDDDPPKEEVPPPDHIPTPPNKPSFYDMKVETSGEGQQCADRTFEVKPGTLSVKARYMFKTQEIPAGYFGSQFNDSYEVTLRAQGSGAEAHDVKTMNDLGLEAFDSAGGTDWMETSLHVGEEAETVQVIIGVSNVGDGLYDSDLILDYVAERKVEIGTLKGVGKGNTLPVEVKVSSELQKPVTLSIVAEGTGQATFGDGSTEMTINETTTVQVKGVEASSNAGDLRLEAKVEGETLDHTEFSVVWVKLSARGTGTPSPGNSAAAEFASVQGTDILDVHWNQNLHAWANGVETMGMVTPEDYPGKIILKKTRWVRAYKDNDPEPIVTQDGEPERDFDFACDFEAPPDGKVYTLDAPCMASPLGIGDSTLRLRYRFRQWAELDYGSGSRYEFPEYRASDDIYWFSALSFKVQSGEYVLVYDVPGDNCGGEGMPPMSWNMQ